MNTSTRRIAGLMTAATVTSGLVVTGLASSASASDYLEPCQLDKKVAELTEYGSRTDVNIVVWKASQHQSSHFNGIVEQGSVSTTPCAEIPISNSDEYKWVVFTGDGQFVRKGDGGYRNWAFFGVFDRSEDTVVNFTAR